jgi:hypothetical protein
MPKDRIFPSRDMSFAQGIARGTGGYDVGIALNSLSGERFQTSWECIARFRRSIEISRADIMANSQLPTAVFTKNMTFATVNLAAFVETNVRLTTELLLKE